MRAAVRALAVKKAELSVRLDNVVRRLGSKHRTVLQLRFMIEALDRGVQDRRRQILQELAPPATRPEQIAWGKPSRGVMCGVSIDRSRYHVGE